ncbi:MAG: hypothetical protein AAF564_25415, partial [Bacteroidota bacterium]
ELESRRAGLETRLGLPFTQQDSLEQLLAMKNELQALLQSDASTHTEANEASTEASEQTEGNAPPQQSTEQEQAERIQALVTAFDALMAGRASTREGSESGTEADDPPDPSMQIPASHRSSSPHLGPRWTERLQSANADDRQPTLLEVA